MQTSVSKQTYNPYEKLSKTSLVFRSLIESIPFGIGPYGIGDIISLYEGIKGQMIFGPKIDFIDRLISFFAACIPLLPATPLRIFAAKIRGKLS